MDKISAKQIEGVVDTTTSQSIAGEKTFESPTFFLAQNGKDYTAMCIDGLFVYWLVVDGAFEIDGTRRFGFDMTTGRFGLQEYQSGQWTDISF